MECEGRWWEVNVELALAMWMESERVDRVFQFNPSRKNEGNWE